MIRQLSLIALLLLTPAGTVIDMVGARPTFDNRTRGNSGTAIDRNGNLLLAESFHQTTSPDEPRGILGRVQKVTPDGTITTVAGYGAADMNGVPLPDSRSLRFDPSDGSAIAVEGAGNLFFAELWESRLTETEVVYTRRIRKVALDGSLSTVIEITHAELNSAARFALTHNLTISGQLVSTVAQDAYAMPGFSGAKEPVAPIATLDLIRRDINERPPVIPQPSMNAPNNGQFEITNIAKGFYDLIVSLPDIHGWGAGGSPGATLRPLAFGRKSVEVDGDVTGVSITVHPGVDLKGRITVDGRPAAPTGMQIHLQPDPAAARIDAYKSVDRFRPVIGADGKFTFPVLPEAQYSIQLTWAGQSNLSVADILLDGKSIADSVIPIGASTPGLLEVILKTGQER